MSSSVCTVKLELDTSDIERAKEDMDLVSRKDVERMIRAALAAYDASLPPRMSGIKARGV